MGGKAKPLASEPPAVAPVAAARDSTVSAAAKPSAQAQPLSGARLTPSIEQLRADAARLKAEAKSLRELADTLNRSSDDAEKRADEARQKAEKIQEELSEQDVRRAAVHIRMEIERAKRLIQADVERVKRARGVSTAEDSVYAFQADSLDSALAHLSNDTSIDASSQKNLAGEIQNDSRELLEKSREMSAKARELEEAADKRDDLADDLAEKADRLAEDRNTTPLSKRFPLHLGFQLRLTDVGPYNQQKLDLLLLHGISLTYSLSSIIEAGLQDVTLYWQDTPFGLRYAVTASPAARFAFFPVKRLQMGAAAGVSVQGRVGAGHPAKMGAAPFVALSSEVWVRNHFSICPIVRLSYAAWGPYYAVALSQHSGVLPQGAAWIDLGVGYNFNF